MLSADSSFAHVFAHGHPAKALGEREHGAPNGAPNGGAKEQYGRMRIFDFLALPENEVPRAAFAEGMITLEIMNGTRGSLDFPWERWDAEGAVFVDVSRGAFPCACRRPDGGGLASGRRFCLFVGRAASVDVVSLSS